MSDGSQRSDVAPVRLQASCAGAGGSVTLSGHVMRGRRDWNAVRAGLDENGWARLPRLLSARACARTRRLWDDDGAFRSRIDMAAHNFGRGEYRYFAYPLPEPVARLRTELYRELAPTAQAWAGRLGRDPSAFPSSLDEFLARCHAAGQRRPTPLLLRYRAGDWNALHQDLYGAVAFPLQVLVVLSARGRDYEGGEVVLVEQRPRAQSRATAFTLDQGDGLVFTNRERPVRGSRGDYRVTMRHGVSIVSAGDRLTLGIIFHDAE